MTTRLNLPHDWLGQARTQEDKESTISSVLAARNALEILHGLLTRRKERLERPTRKDYDTPAWQYLLAHDNGRHEELSYILSLIDPLFPKD